MKDSNIAPFFVCAYAGLAETARKHGYALAIHGSVVTDMDLIAVPWIETASSAETVMLAIKKHLSALCFREILRRNSPPEVSDDEIERQVKEFNEQSPEHKPHGRLSWNLYLYHGVKVDLSVMPLKPTSQ